MMKNNNSREEEEGRIARCCSVFKDLMYWGTLRAISLPFYQRQGHHR